MGTAALGCFSPSPLQAVSLSGHFSNPYKKPQILHLCSFIFLCPHSVIFAPSSYCTRQGNFSCQHAVRPLLLQHSHCRPSTWNTFWILLFRNLSLSPYLISKPCRSLRGGSYPLSVKVMAFKTKASLLGCFWTGKLGSILWKIHVKYHLLSEGNVVHSLTQHETQQFLRGTRIRLSTFPVWRLRSEILGTGLQKMAGQGPGIFPPLPLYPKCDRKPGRIRSNLH